MKISMYFICALFVFATLVSCAPNRVVVGESEHLSNVRKLIDGVTTKSEISDQLLSPINSFENGRILIFMWNPSYENHYHIVTVFDENDILQKHSIIKVR